jgi:hypothetical protein
MSAWRGSEASKNILKSKGEPHTKPQTPSIVEYQTGRTTYMMMKICTGNS